MFNSTVSVLSSYWFLFVMDDLMKNVQGEASWYIMFVDNVLLVDENTNALESKLKYWREVLENNKLKINRAKTEFLR